MDRSDESTPPMGPGEPAEHGSPGEVPSGAPVQRIVLQPSGPLPPVPRSPLLDYALFLCLLAPLVGWQSGHLIWGVVAMPVLFVALAYVGTRHLIGKVGRACEELAAEGRPLDIVPYLQHCQATYPKNPHLREMLDQAARAMVTAHAMALQREHVGPEALSESGEGAPGEGEGGEPGTTYELLTEAPAGGGLAPPVDKVVSGTAVAAWCLAAFAFVPFVGVLPGLALLVLGILLLATPARLLDRKVGYWALVIAGLSLGFTAVLMFGGHFSEAPGLTFKVGAAPWTVKAVGLVVLVLSIVLHECAHGLAAWWAGDTTARDEGRLTLNPIPHVDLFGSVILPAILAFVPGGLMFGWAKPVPVDPQRYRRARLGNIGVSLAGVSVNMMLSAFCAAALAVLGIVLRAAYPDLTVNGFAEPFQPTRFGGIAQPELFNLLVDGLKAGVLINAVLANLNALPIPPLDGFHVLLSILPERWASKLGKLNAYGFMIFLGLLFFRVIDLLLAPGVVVAILLLSMAASAGSMW